MRDNRAKEVSDERPSPASDQKSVGGRAVRAALEIIAAGELPGLRAVAREIGVTAPALYRYFDSAAALAGAVASEVDSNLAGQMRLLPRTDDPPSEVRARIKFLVDWARSNRLEFEVLLGLHAAFQDRSSGRIVWRPVHASQTVAALYEPIAQSSPTSPPLGGPRATLSSSAPAFQMLAFWSSLVGCLLIEASNDVDASNRVISAAVDAHLAAIEAATTSTSESSNDPARPQHRGC